MTRFTPILSIGLVAGAFVALGAVAPASAEPGALPDTDTIYAVDCDANDGQLWQVDPTTAALNPIGTGTTDPEFDCAGQSAFDPSTGRSYWLSWADDDYLVEVDTATGVSTPIGVFIDAATEAEISIYSIAIGADGSAFAIDYNSYLYSLDLDTAVITLIDDLGVDTEFYSFAFNPADGKFYAYGEYDTEPGLYSVDVATATPTLITPGADSPLRAFGISFASDGTLWAFGDSPADVDDDWVLYSTTTTDFAGDIVVAGVTYEGDEEFFSESPFITYFEAPVVTPVAPEPALAATGTELPIAGAVLALGLLGAGAVIVARRRTA